MPFDKTKLFLMNKDIVLERTTISSKVEEWDVVWFMDGVWRPVDGTLNLYNGYRFINLTDNKLYTYVTEDPMPIHDYNWGIAYHVDHETHTAQIIYDGELKGCSLINTVGKWYADRHGKLTQTETNFYVGYCLAPTTLVIELNELLFVCNNTVVYPELTDEWGNEESEDVLKLELLTDVDTYLKWGKDAPEDTTGYLEDVSVPTRYEITSEAFSLNHDNALFFKVSSTNAIMPETCAIALDGCMEVGVDYKVEITDADGVVLDEEDEIGELFVISPIEDSDPNVAYFKITLLKSFEEVAKSGNSLDIYFTDANIQRCDKANSVFYIWFPVVD
jgi:hypothetical protein